MPKTAVLIHAQFLPPGTWKKVMWGEPENNISGVIPTGLKVAKEFNANFIYLCSGVPINGGRTMSPNALAYAERHVNSLPSILRKVLEETTIRQDEISQTTQEEVERAARRFAEWEVDRVIQVSVPAHVFRAHKNTIESKMAGNFKGMSIMAVASDVDFPGTSASTTVIVEKPHRSDAIPFNTTKYVKAIIDLLRNNPSNVFEEFLSGLGYLLKKYGVKVDWQPRD